MKRNYRIYLILVLAMCGMDAFGQNTPLLSETAPAGTVLSPVSEVPLIPAGGRYNYTRTYVPRVATSNTASLTTSALPAHTAIATSYKDGFGRVMENVVHHFLPGKSFVAFSDTKDKREIISFLPYTADGTGFRPNPFLEQRAFYAAHHAAEGRTAYSKQTNNSTDAVREGKSYIPGKSQVGQDRAVTVKNITNNASQVRSWRLTAAGLPVSYGFYAVDELIGEETLEINGGRTRVFKDKSGALVYKSVLLEGTTEAVNYYVYDEMGNLVFDITPKGTATFATATGTVNPGATVLDSLCFEYRYDLKNRLVAQRKPGEVGYIEMVYDRKGRLVMRRSQLEATLGKWEISFYDQNDRVIATSLLSNSSTRDYWQTQIDATLATASLANSNLLYYTATDGGEGIYPAAALTGNEVMSYSFYDHYGHAALAAVFGDAFSAAEFTESPVGAEPSNYVRTRKGGNIHDSADLG